MTHHMTPTGTAVLLLLAAVVDYVSIGPNYIRDRIAFLMVIAAVYEGFNGSVADEWTLDLLKGFIASALDASGDAYIHSAAPAAIVGMLVFGLWLYGLACLLPNKLNKKVGRWSTINFPPSGVWAINWKLWLVAIGLALLGDVPLGWVGDLTLGTNQALAAFFAPLPAFLLGGN